MLIFIFSCTSKTGKTENENSTFDQNSKMAWWREAKFGMFIHWGLYAIPANSSEWHMRNFKKSIAEYSKYAGQFNPTQFNADKWVKIANEAGMKYMVITTKHHDGFALFKSEASPYNMVDATPFKRDIIKELASACLKNDIRLGLYYSLMADWGHPGGGIGCAPWDSAQVGNLDTYFNTVAFPQVKELLVNYGSLAELWFDTDGASKPRPDKAARIDSLIAELQPQILVNNRVIPGDFDIAERNTPPHPIQGDWEACDLIIDGSWGYKKYVPDDVKPIPELIKQLIDVVSKGGNMLLNVGPKADGTFPEETVDRLKGIGEWLKINGEAIYGTSKSPFDYLPWGRCTRKGNDLYLHVFDWPSNGKIVVPMSNKVISAQMLDNKYKDPIRYSTSRGELTLQLPAVPTNSIVSVVKLKVKGDIQPVHSLALNKRAFTSFNVQVSNITDGDPSTYWESKDSAPCWIMVDLGDMKRFNTIRVGHGGGEVTRFSFKYMEDGHWKTIFKDENLPRNEYVHCFPEVSAQKVWFDMEEVGAIDKIRINSFELFDAH